jgi:hypothetical protein
VRAQELGAPSREWRNREEQGSPLDPGHGRTIGSEPHRAYRLIAFGGSEVERTSSRHQKSRTRVIDEKFIMPEWVCDTQLNYLMNC